MGGAYVTTHGAVGFYNFMNLQTQKPSSQTKGALHPDTKPYKDPDPQQYEGGYRPDDVVIDHKVNRARGGQDVPSNRVPEPRDMNARKGGLEGQLQRLRDYYRSHGLRDEQIDKILADEIRWIERDVHPRPVDPSKLDKLPAPE